MSINDVSQALIFASSYFEYVKLRSALKKSGAFFLSISEYTKERVIKRRLKKLNKKEFFYLLVSERAYFFGILEAVKFEHLIFFSPPKNTWIFDELIKGLNVNEETENKVICLFTIYDFFALERIVGSKNAKALTNEQSLTNYFVY